MTSDQQFTLWAAALTALPTIIFTGAVAYWNWKRDQERLIVKKGFLHWAPQDGKLTNANLTGVTITITNLSLYPVRVGALGFTTGGRNLVLLNREARDGREWPSVLPSREMMKVAANNNELKQLEALGLRNGLSERKLVAVAATATGKLFFSKRFGVGKTGLRTDIYESHRI